MAKTFKTTGHYSFDHRHISYHYWKTSKLYWFLQLLLKIKHRYKSHKSLSSILPALSSLLKLGSVLPQPLFNISWISHLIFHQFITELKSKFLHLGFFILALFQFSHHFYKSWSFCCAGILNESIRIHNTLKYTLLCNVTKFVRYRLCFILYVNFCSRWFFCFKSFIRTKAMWRFSTLGLVPRPTSQVKIFI